MRRPVEILHAFPSGSRFWVQVRFHRQHEAEARAAVARRALTAGWDPDAGVRVETSSESRNWLTQEHWFSMSLPLARLAEMDASELESEQVLLGFDARRIAAMCAARQRHLEARHPLFAAAGALEEVCTVPDPLRQMFSLFEEESKEPVFEAACRQRAWQRRRLAVALLGAETVAELDAYRERVLPNTVGYSVNFWHEVLKDPAGKLADVRRVREIQEANERRRAAAVSARDEVAA